MQTTALDIPIHPEIFTRCSITFTDWAVLRLTPTRRDTTCSGDWTKLGVTKPSQAWMPSTHAWPYSLSPTSPQFLNQSPPRAQQLRVPDFFTMPHLEHTGLSIFGVIVSVEGAGISGRTCILVFWYFYILVFWYFHILVFWDDTATGSASPMHHNTKHQTSSPATAASGRDVGLSIPNAVPLTETAVSVMW